MYALRWFYSDGQGVPKVPGKGREWFMRVRLSTVAVLSIGFPAIPPAGSEPASVKRFLALCTLSWRSSKIKGCPFYNVPAAGRKSLRPRVKRCRHETLALGEAEIGLPDHSR